MRILFLCHAFNGLAQRLFVELRDRGHDVSIELDVNDAVTAQAVALANPELVVAPFLKRAIPASVWSRVRCLVVHPGILGDRGPSALDWAILEGEREWGVTVLEAVAEMDAGPVWACRSFPMREAPKSSLYRREVTEAALEAVLEAVQRIQVGGVPLPVEAAPRRGRARPLMRAADRAIDWSRDGTTTVIRKIHSADSFPGVRDEVCGVPVRLFGAHREPTLRGGAPGEVFATRDGAILRATVDGAVWITHLQSLAEGEEPTLKLPATEVLGDALGEVPEHPVALDAPALPATWRELRYEERGAVGILHFPFHNGAMSTAQCRRLLAALHHARARPTSVLVLAGGPESWSNGIHLNAIESSGRPAEASWENINAIDDVARAILTDTTRITISAVAANAGAGGVFLALAADEVWMRDGVVLNPHYKGMGNLYGSEYWTYVLPRRVGEARAREITERRLPMGAREAEGLGLADARLRGTPESFLEECIARARELAGRASLPRMLESKRRHRERDEAAKPLEKYREEELARMKLNFFGFDPSYHVARYHFVFKLPKARTPHYLARHRAARAA